jgi:hypothetical protein
VTVALRGATAREDASLADQLAAGNSNFAAGAKLTVSGAFSCVVRRVSDGAELDVDAIEHQTTERYASSELRVTGSRPVLVRVGKTWMMQNQPSMRWVQVPHERTVTSTTRRLVLARNGQPIAGDDDIAAACAVNAKVESNVDVLDGLAVAWSVRWRGHARDAVDAGVESRAESLDRIVEVVRTRTRAAPYN